MSTADAVKRLAHQFNEELLLHQAGQWASAAMPVCKDVISTVKKIIKDKKEPPASRLMALKVILTQLFHQCMLKGNPSFLAFAAKKIMSRLTILGSHKKTIRDSNRGEDIFGPISVASEQSRTASAEFLRCLLTYIRTWSQKFGRMQDGSTSVFAQSYIKLTNFGVAFPPGEPPRVNVQQRPGSSAAPSISQSLPSNHGLSQPLSRQEIDSQSNSAQLLSELLNHPNPDPETTAQLHANLSAFLLRIERELNLKTGQEGMEDYISQLFELNDFLRGVLERYEKLKLSAPRPSIGPPPQADDFDSSFPQPPKPRSPGLSPSQSSSPLQAQLQEKEATLRSLQDELSRAKREVAEYLQAADRHKALCLQAKSMGEADLRAQEERFSQEIKSREALSATIPKANSAKSRLLALQSQIADMRDKQRSRDGEHRAVVKAIASAQDENRRLRAALGNLPIIASLPPQREPAYAPQEFQSLRPSLAGMENLTVERPDAIDVMRRPPDNLTFIPLALQIDKGLVYSDSFIEVGFMFKPGQAGAMLMYIGNKGQGEISGLKTMMFGLQAEGLSVTVNKEGEEQVVVPRSKVNRTVTIQKTGVFVNIPRLYLPYQYLSHSLGADSRSLTLLLPISIIRYLSPHLSAKDSDLQAAWRRLEGLDSNIAINAVPEELLAGVRFEGYLEKGEVDGECAVFGSFEGESLAVVISRRGSISARSPHTKLREALLNVIYQILKS